MAAAVAVAEVVVAEDVLVKWARFKSKGLFQVQLAFSSISPPRRVFVFGLV